MSGRRPRVSIIVLNRDGEDYLQACLPSLEALDYPRDRLEILVVDNASTDGSVPYIRREHPRVAVVRNLKNEGYARPNNEAARMAGGSYLAFLNNDIRVERDWLEKMLRPMRVSKGVVCVASKMVSWNGERIDYAGGTVSFEGRGFQTAFGEVRGEGKESHRETLFPCSGAMLIQKEAFLGAGGFDEDLFWHYVDVDLGWRLWVLGQRVVYTPEAICYHVHGGTSSAHPGHQKLHLLERNGVLVALKNLDDENAFRVLPVSLLLQAHRVMMGGEIPRARYALDSDEPLGDGERLALESATPLVAIHSIAGLLPRILEKREDIQKRRRRSDAEILSRFGDSWEEPASRDLGPGYARLQRRLLEMFDLRSATRPDRQSQRRVLVISTDYLGKEMAGPAIRCWEMARCLAPEFTVTLGIPNRAEIETEGFRLLSYTPRDHRALMEEARQSDIIVIQGWALYHLTFLRDLKKIFVVDLYCPFPIENLNLHRFNEQALEERQGSHALNLIVANEQVLLGDFFLCANERQRDYWLGVFTALNRLNVETFDDDLSLERMIATVPFGIPDARPVWTKAVLKDAVPGIFAEDKVIIWAGGIFNWFDPETLVLAMDRVWKRRRDVKLFFLGTRHPNPEVPAMRVQAEMMDLTRHLDLHNRCIFFNEKGYVPYGERANYLLESDFGVSTHRHGVEARLASRTRFLDYIWAGLPILCTEGDSLAEMVSREGLGITVPEGDPEALAEAILRLASDPEEVQRMRERLDHVRERFVWGRVLEPLREFCRNPTHAPDKGPSWAGPPSLHRMHREGQLKEGALVAITERIHSQDEAMRKAEKRARESRGKLAEALRRERKWTEKIADLEKTLKTLEDRLRGAQKELSDKRVHVRNLEAMIQRGGLKAP